MNNLKNKEDKTSCIIAKMSVTASTLKPGNFIYDENDKEVYEVVVKKDNKSSGNSVHLTLQNFRTNHRTDKHYGHDHHVRTVDPVYTLYTFSHLLDREGNHQYLSLIAKDNTPREDLFVEDQVVIQGLKKSIDDHKEKEKNLLVGVTSLTVDTIHRADKEVNIEKVTHIDGVDMKHLYDHHHHHHHVHH